MPDWRRNYISWGFVFAVIAAVTQYCISVMLYVYGIQTQKQQILRRRIPPAPRRPALKQRDVYFETENEITEVQLVSVQPLSPRTAKRVRFESRLEHERKTLLRKRPALHDGHTDI
ncbi:hypothetical protein BV898_09605 [Hypsibius exemplaris]|uniref:Uncharacterized protein n=1 Tax=Hypsibius exemplaris TaxID=2072580 RepID=A0A1W0WMB3_HYPEX|nr:hypothetical protein BV898_09605 [Hypsibius exemplaris]